MSARRGHGQCRAWHIGQVADPTYPGHMARSSLTLAASVTSALPRVGVVGVGMLTENTAGRFDCAVAELDDGRRVVVRAPVDASAATELAAQTRALRALTAGVRGLLPFDAPQLLGETGIGDSHAVVVDFLPGYRVDAAHLPAGRGAATSIGRALAAVHALPQSIVRDEGLPVRTPQQLRADAARTIDRSETTRRTPPTLIARWRRAIATDALWRFDSAVVLGGAGSASFLFEDTSDGPAVTGVLDWHGFSVGDPAGDLQWLASAPHAAVDVFDAYCASSSRAPDALVRQRARLYAELEFAGWLVHGHDLGSEEIVDDAMGLLSALADAVRGEDIVPESALDVDDAIALLGRMPEASRTSVDTSMHTDAYDPAELSMFIADDAYEESPSSRAVDLDVPADPSGAGRPVALPIPVSAGDDVSTAPIDISSWVRSTDAESNTSLDDVAEADRSAEAALRRWTGTAE